MHVVQASYKTAVSEGEALWLDVACPVPIADLIDDDEDAVDVMQVQETEGEPDFGRHDVFAALDEDLEDDLEDDEAVGLEDNDNGEAEPMEQSDLDDEVEDAKASVSAQVARAVHLSATKPKKKTKGANMRKSYTLKVKFNALVHMEKVEAELHFLRDAESLSRPTLMDIATHCSVGLHVKALTLYQWLQVTERKKIREAYNRNYRVRGTGGVSVRRIGLHGMHSGRRPLFALSERIVGDEVRRKRSLHLPVSVARMVTLLKEESQREISLLESRGVGLGILDRMRACKFSKKMINSFMRRERLSVRKVTCIKMIPLEEAVRLLRGFYVYLIHRVLVDSDNFASSFLDPEFGRYLLRCRFNKDEVPFRLGSSIKTVSSADDRSTHVRCLPGFGDRIGTLIMTIDGSGYLLDIGIIFRGQGVTQERYNVAGVKVWYQPKAWICEEVELKWWREIFLPYSKELKNEGHVEFLMLHDGVGPHLARECCFLFSVGWRLMILNLQATMKEYVVID